MDTGERGDDVPVFADRAGEAHRRAQEAGRRVAELRVWLVRICDPEAGTRTGDVVSADVSTVDTARHRASGAAHRLRNAYDRAAAAHDRAAEVHEWLAGRHADERGEYHHQRAAQHRRDAALDRARRDALQ